jgi:hypothetical protein
MVAEEGGGTGAQRRAGGRKVARARPAAVTRIDDGLLLKEEPASSAGIAEPPRAVQKLSAQLVPAAEGAGPARP